MSVVDQLQLCSVLKVKTIVSTQDLMQRWMSFTKKKYQLSPMFPKLYK